MSESGGHLLGLDIGGTRSRAVLCTLDGVRLGSGDAEGGNPNAHPPVLAAQRVRAVVEQALGTHDAARVRAGVVGLAGYSKLSDPEVHAVFAAAWRGAGLRCPLRVVPDSVAAFAAGTTEPAGTVLVAGTGSAAVRVAERRPARTVGGHGWLLGDEGSAYWLGREAVRLVLAALEEWQRGTMTELDTATILDAASTEPAGEWPGEASEHSAAGFPLSLLQAAVGDVWRDVDPRRAIELLITAVNAEPPVRLARFAPLVTTAAARGSVPARDLVRRAVTALAALITGAREAGERTPIVLTGSLLAPGNPVGDGLRTLLAGPVTGTVAGSIHTATDAAAGAAWLAALDLPGMTESAAHAVHRRLLG